MYAKSRHVLHLPYFLPSILDCHLVFRLPRHRLDAGTFGTMGVGLGFAIAAALYARDYAPGQKVICVEGDSAFGFSGMEMETIYRYNLPIVIIIVNNNGESFWGLSSAILVMGQVVATGNRSKWVSLTSCYYSFYIYICLSLIAWFI